MPRDFSVYLQDILEAIAKVQRYTGIKQTPGRSGGLICQKVDPPHAMPDLHAVVH